MGDAPIPLQPCRALNPYLPSAEQRETFLRGYKFVKEVSQAYVSSFLFVNDSPAIHLGKVKLNTGVLQAIAGILAGIACSILMISTSPGFTWHTIIDIIAITFGIASLIVGALWLYRSALDAENGTRLVVVSLATGHVLSRESWKLLERKISKIGETLYAKKVFNSGGNQIAMLMAFKSVENARDAVAVWNGPFLGADIVCEFMRVGFEDSRDPLVDYLSHKNPPANWELAGQSWAYQKHYNSLRDFEVRLEAQEMKNKIKFSGFQVDISSVLNFLILVMTFFCVWSSMVGASRVAESVKWFHVGAATSCVAGALCSIFSLMMNKSGTLGPCVVISNFHLDTSFETVRELLPNAAAYSWFHLFRTSMEIIVIVRCRDGNNAESVKMSMNRKQIGARVLMAEIVE